MEKKLSGLVDKMLFDYPKIDKFVEERREAIEHPWIERDENVGGGKGNKISKPIENMIISIDEDKILTGLVNQKNAIYDALQNVKEEHLQIIKRYYFYNQARFYSLNDLVQKFGIPRATFFRGLTAFKHEILSNLSLNYLEWQCDASEDDDILPF